MTNLKQFARIAFGVFVLLLTTAVVTEHTTRAVTKPPHRYYLTKTGFDGMHALAACTTGFHMASLWEIFDTSNLNYDTTLGFTQDDSGSGPPAEFAFGWIRTGITSNSSAAGGQGNCNAWTSNNSGANGSEVFLTDLWADTTSIRSISPWFPRTDTCDTSQKVWCVQNAGD